MNAIKTFAYDIGGANFEIGPDGALTISTGHMDSPAYGVDPDTAYALYLFFAKLPHVGPLMEARHTARQLFLYGDLSDTTNAEGFHAAASPAHRIRQAREQARDQAPAAPPVDQDGELRAYLALRRRVERDDKPQAEVIAEAAARVEHDTAALAAAEVAGNAVQIERSRADLRVAVLMLHDAEHHTATYSLRELAHNLPDAADDVIPAGRQIRTAGTISAPCAGPGRWLAWLTDGEHSFYLSATADALGAERLAVLAALPVGSPIIVTGRLALAQFDTPALLLTSWEAGDLSAASDDQIVAMIPAVAELARQQQPARDQAPE